MSFLKVLRPILTSIQSALLIIHPVHGRILCALARVLLRRSCSLTGTKRDRTLLCHISLVPRVPVPVQRPA